jgi:hypothetical protein
MRRKAHKNHSKVVLVSHYGMLLEQCPGCNRWLADGATASVKKRAGLMGDIAGARKGKSAMENVESKARVGRRSLSDRTAAMRSS